MTLLSNIVTIYLILPFSMYETMKHAVDTQEKFTTHYTINAMKTITLTDEQFIL